MGCYVAHLTPGGKSRRLDFATNSQATSRAATKRKPNLPKATNSQGQSWKNWELGAKVSETFVATQIELGQSTNGSE